MNKEWALTQDAFDRLLDWLNADRNRAGIRYEEIRSRLIKVFIGRGCMAAEDLADETINRVAARIGDVARDYEGDPASYFYGVCQNVHFEYVRKKDALDTRDFPGSNSVTLRTNLSDDCEPEYQCLERCLGHLSNKNRDLVLRYYQEDKQAKIDQRKLQAKELGIAVNALRIRAYRIRLQLERCVLDCLKKDVARMK